MSQPSPTRLSATVALCLLWAPAAARQASIFSDGKADARMARALVVFPGGFGTFDELSETLNLVQTGKIEPIPVVLFDEAYWRRVINFDAMVEERVIAAGALGLFVFVETAEEAFEMICADMDNEPCR